MNQRDMMAIVVGGAAWGAAIPAVILAGRYTTISSSTTNKIIAVGLGAGIAYITTPALSYLCGWESRAERVRGIALALGTAQTLDGLIHLAHPGFYSNLPSEAIACAANIFLGAGLLGIFSVYS